MGEQRERGVELSSVSRFLSVSGSRYFDSSGNFSGSSGFSFGNSVFHFCLSKVERVAIYHCAHFWIA